MFIHRSYIIGKTCLKNYKKIKFIGNQNDKSVLRFRKESGENVANLEDIVYIGV